MTAAARERVSGPWPDLPPVSLEELVSRAALLTRTDRKYVVPVDRLADLRLLVGGDARVLEIAGVRSFGYSSTYFDTPDLAGFTAAARRRRRRFKARVRRYLDSGECWFEVKTRGLRGTTVKERIRLVEDPGPHLPPEAHDLFESRLREAGMSAVDPRSLSPTLHAGYRRTTLLVPDCDTRLTIDTALSWHSPDGTAAVHIDTAAVVETKAPPGPASRVDRGLWALGHRPRRLSKYGTGLVMLDPSLPHHRWHRVLTHELAAG